MIIGKKTDFSCSFSVLLKKEYRNAIIKQKGGEQYEKSIKFFYKSRKKKCSECVEKRCEHNYLHCNLSAKSARSSQQIQKA